MEDVEQTAEEPLPREVESWMTKVEKVPTTTVTDQQGQAIMQPSMPPAATIVLPVTRQTFTSGLKKKIEEAGRWLSEYIFRIIKIKDGKVKFKEQ